MRWISKVKLEDVWLNKKYSRKNFRVVVKETFIFKDVLKLTVFYMYLVKIGTEI